MAYLENYMNSHKEFIINVIAVIGIVTVFAVFMGPYGAMGSMAGAFISELHNRIYKK